MRLIALAVIATAVLGGGAHGQERLRVVATFSILADLARELGGDTVEVTSLVVPGGDSHAYQPTPGDARAVADADLVVVNGLGFEGWMDRLIAASGYAGPIVVASRNVQALAATGEHAVAESNGHHDDRGAQGRDPHAWQSVPNALAYVQVIEEALSGADPDHATDYRHRAADYSNALQTLDREIRSAVATLPPARRTVITSHDAFGYYAAEYGLKFLAPAGLSTESEPSAGAVAALVRQVQQSDARAIFVESVTDPRLVQQIARETGAVVGGELYSDALSPEDGPASTYLSMMRHNTRVITGALGS
jgi:zinc/manganese transport system substrate-binding protein